MNGTGLVHFFVLMLFMLLYFHNTLHLGPTMMVSVCGDYGCFRLGGKHAH